MLVQSNQQEICIKQQEPRCYYKREPRIIISNNRFHVCKNLVEKVCFSFSYQKLFDRIEREYNFLYINYALIEVCGKLCTTVIYSFAGIWFCMLNLHQYLTLFEQGDNLFKLFSSITPECCTTLVNLWTKINSCLTCCL